MGKTFSVDDFAKLAGVEVASARVMLRKVAAKKKGATYEFNSKEEMQKLIDKARSGKKTTKAPAKKKVIVKKKKAPAKKKEEPATE